MRKMRVSYFVIVLCNFTVGNDSRMALVRSKIQKFSWGSMPPDSPPPDIKVTCPTITDILATPLVLSKVQVLIWRLLSLMSQPSLMSQLDHIITKFLSDKQGVGTLISTALRVVTGDYDPVYGGCRCGLPYSIKKGTQSY